LGLKFGFGWNQTSGEVLASVNIAKPAVAAHLAHGDTEGACPVVVEEPVITEELPDDRIVPEDMPPADEIEADVPAEPTHEEVIAQLLVEAEGLTEGALKDGFLTLPEVQMSLFGMTFSYAVVLEEIIAEDGSTTLVVAGINEVEAREGVASATYSLEDGQATIQWSTSPLLTKRVLRQFLIITLF
jgi:hypothetical protein